MRRAIPVFAAVFVCFNAFVAALFFYTLGRGSDAMRTGEIENTLFSSVCETTLDALMLPGMLLWQAIPDTLRTNALEWALILLVHTIYCIVITVILLRLLRWMRHRTETTSAPVETLLRH